MEGEENSNQSIEFDEGRSNFEPVERQSRLAKMLINANIVDTEEQAHWVLVGVIALVIIVIGMIFITSGEPEGNDPLQYEQHPDLLR